MIDSVMRVLGCVGRVYYKTIFLFLIHFFLLESIFCGIQNLISIFLWCAQFCDLNNNIVFLPSVSKPKLAIFVTWLNICTKDLCTCFVPLF